MRFVIAVDEQDLFQHEVRVMTSSDRHDVVKQSNERRGGSIAAVFGVLPVTLLCAACLQDDSDMDDPSSEPSDVGDPDVSPDRSLVASLNLRLADTVIAAPGATGTGFGDPARAVNGVRGAGARAGSLDVFSRGYLPGQNDHITLAWSSGRLRNGAGADLVVFENPFLINGGGGSFMDLLIVEVSIDGIEFRELAHDYTAANPAVYQKDPSLWQGFAGRTPVLFHAQTNPVDPFNAALAGGDQLDLDTVVGNDALAASIRSEGVRFVRLVCAPARVNPDTGSKYVRDALSNGADIDGVYGRYVEND